MRESVPWALQTSVLMKQRDATRRTWHGILTENLFLASCNVFGPIVAFRDHRRIAQGWVRENVWSFK